MSDFFNALLNGPKAAFDFVVNESVCVIADALIKQEEKAMEKRQYEEETKRINASQNKKFYTLSSEVVVEQPAEEVKQQQELDDEVTPQSLKAEIIEFKKIKDTAESVLNADFVSFDNSDVETELVGDELTNTVEKITDTVIERSELNLDDPDSRKHIKFIVLTAMLAIGKVKLTDIMDNDEFNIKTRDDLVELNTIYKFFTGMVIFTSVSSIQLNEFITAQLLYETVSVLGEHDDWNLQSNMAEIISKAYKRLEIESASAGKLNGLDEMETVSPIRFDNSILNSDLFDKSARVPRINKTSKEFVLNYLNTILPEDWIKDNNIVFDLERKLDPLDNNRDTGAAYLKVLYEGGTAATRMYELDLDSIAGNGYSLLINSYNPLNKGIPYPLFVNMEKFPKVVSKFLTTEGRYILNNPTDPDSIIEFGEVVKDNYGVANSEETLWYFFDFSGMSKHFAFMSNDDKRKFATNLTNIHKRGNWNLIVALNGTMPRMRIRRFTSPDKFTLVSDSKTKQQWATFNGVIDNSYKKYFNDLNQEVNPNGDVVDKHVLVLKYDNGNVTLSLNGTEIPFNILVQEPSANPAIDMLRNMGELNNHPYPLPW